MSEEDKRREEILEVRAEHKRLSEKIIQGTAYHETVTVRGTDGKEYAVEVRAVNDAEFIAACIAADVPVPAPGESMNLGSNLKLLAALAVAGTSDPDLPKVLAPFETGKIGAKVLELSRAPKS